MFQALQQSAAAVVPDGEVAWNGQHTHTRMASACAADGTSCTTESYTTELNSYTTEHAGVPLWGLKSSAVT